MLTIPSCIYFVSNNVKNCTAQKVRSHHIRHGANGFRRFPGMCSLAIFGGKAHKKAADFPM